MFLKTFGWSFAVTIIALVVAFLYGGPQALILCLILGILEISLSFDNAVVNARILERMNPFWQKMFLSVGIIIAVFGMRILFPLLIVGVTAGLNPVEAVSLAMEKGDPHTPGSYGYLLHEAHPQIAAFGGMFLLMLFLDFILAHRDIKWIKFLEIPLARLGKLEGASLIIGMAALAIAGAVAGEKQGIVLLAGLLGMITYFLVNGLGNLFDVDEDGDVDAADADLVVHSGPSGTAQLAGKAALMLFLYLEVIDASFSFDGVIGAFAITSDPDHHCPRTGLHRRYVRPLPDRIPGPAGDAGRIRIPGPRRTLGHRRPGSHPAGHYRGPRQRDRYRPHRSRVHRCGIYRLGSTQ